MSLWLESAVFPVVLDSCVLYPHMLRDLLLEASNAHLYRVHWSPRILEDMLRNVVKDRRITSDHANRLRFKMNAAFPSASVTPAAGIAEAVACHPDDRHVVATAMAAKAELIVTDNISNFPAQALNPLGIEAVTSDKFLCDLWDLQPEVLLRCLQIVVSRQKDPRRRTMNFVLDNLNQQAKDFVSYVKDCEMVAPSARR